MTCKGPKESLACKLGFRAGGVAPKAEVELERLRKENGHLRRKLDELAKRHGKTPDPDKSKAQEAVAAVALQAQLEQQRAEAERREHLFKSQAEEMQNLKNKMAALEGQHAQQNGQTQAQVPPGDLVVLHDQLRDALDKNKQWLVYDQQREAYVQCLVMRAVELEQQLNQANQNQTQQESSSGGPTEERLAELSSLQRRLEEQSLELQRAKEQLEAERLCSRKDPRKEERDLDGTTLLFLQLEEEKKRSTKLQLQVDRMQNSLLNQNGDQRRISVLEQEIQLSVQRFEDEKIRRKKQQHKLLRKLQNAHEEIERLQANQSESRHLEFARLAIRDSAEFGLDSVSPSRAVDLLDESILECPNCQIPYPVSQHRQLLAHIEFCLD